MKRILIIGSSGAGKSTFARSLHEATGIELIHLDKVFWKPNWVETPKDEWKKTVEDLLTKDSWIMDGNFGGTMEMRIAACDTVIFLDLPRTICVWRAYKRVLIYKKNSRPDMAEGCDERFDLEFLKWIWDYPKRTKPKVEALLKQFQAAKNIVRLTSTKEIENFFDNYSEVSMIKYRRKEIFMGQVVIEIPQNVNRSFRVKDSEFGEKLLRDLEQNSNPAETPAIVPPRRNSLKEDGDAVLGIWADRPESAEEISRRIRDRNNGKI